MNRKKKPRKRFTCKHCGKEFFDVINRRRVFCSAKCRNEYGTSSVDPIEKTCPTCKKVFHVLPYESRRIYCSTYCSNTRNSKDIRKITCLHCGIKFEYIHHGKKKERKYCSKECQLAHIRRQPRKCAFCGNEFSSGKKKKGAVPKYCSPKCLGLARRVPRVEKRCDTCGKAMPVPQYLINRKRYCSEVCRLRKGNSSASENKVVDLVTSLLQEEPKRQYTFDWLINQETNMHLYADAYFPEHNLVVEYDGEQHYKYVPHMHITRDNFIKMQARDERKEELLHQHGVLLLRIRYNEPETREHLEYRLSNLLDY